jgi:hypothetical protein
MSQLTEQIELDNVDSDIREAYLPWTNGRYRTGEPTEIQTCRYLREINNNLVILIEILKDSNDRSNTGS